MDTDPELELLAPCPEPPPPPPAIAGCCKPEEKYYKPELQRRFLLDFGEGSEKDLL